MGRDLRDHPASAFGSRNTEWTGRPDRKANKYYYAT